MVSLLASRSLLGNSQKSGPESATRGTFLPGEIIPEWRAATVGGIISESGGGIIPE
jgi:hypothetical protein